MKKCFNNVQMFKSSEDCNKFSKSVSYETLVIGATTIGTECVQNQWLSKGSADKPLSAVGTLTSLLCNSAKVVEKWLRHVITRRTSVRRGYLPEQATHANEESLFASVTWLMRLPRRILRMLLVMTIPALALIFTLITTAESRAECYATERNWINTCYVWNPGVADNCGEGCTYTYDNGKLTVTATKPDAVVSNGMFSPEYYESGKFPTVSDIEIDGEFEKIGMFAFLNNHNATIHGKDWVLLVNETGSNSFDGSNVSGTVIVNDGLTRLGDGPWSNLWTGFNGTLILPPSITSVKDWFLRNLTLGADAKVYCGAEKCEELFRNFDCDKTGKTRDESWISKCKDHLNDLLSGKLLAYPDGCTKMGASGCTKCKNANFKLNDGECDRLRWTPAEAAKVLTDDNNNTVTITFRK